MKKYLSIILVAVVVCLCLASCSKNKTVEYYAWMFCSPDLLHYATPVVEFSDYSGSAQIDTLKEADFELVSSPGDVQGEITTPVLRCDLVNKCYAGDGVNIKLVVKYLPKNVEYNGEDICLDRAMCDSVVVKEGKDSFKEILFKNKLDLATHSGQQYLDQLFEQQDVIICVVSPTGDVVQTFSGKKD